MKKALAAIKRTAYYAYFFDHLTSAAWIGPLSEAGLFQSGPEPTREGQYLRFPIWPASRYLARVATSSPREVMEIALRIETENFRVHEDLVDAALATPADAWWVRRHISEGAVRKEPVQQGFDEMPEVQDVLDFHLDAAVEPAAAIRAVYAPVWGGARRRARFFALPSKVQTVRLGSTQSTLCII